MKDLKKSISIALMLTAFAMCAAGMLYLSNKIDDAAQVESFVNHSEIPNPIER